MSVPTIKFPVQFAQIPVEVKKFRDCISAAAADIEVARTMLELIRKGCKHERAVHGYNERDGSWMNECPHCGEQMSKSSGSFLHVSRSWAYLDFALSENAQAITVTVHFKEGDDRGYALLSKEDLDRPDDEVEKVCIDTMEFDGNDFHLTPEELKACRDELRIHR